MRAKTIPCLGAVLVLLTALPRPSLSQIPVEGLEDKTVYADRVSFRVLSEPGYDTTAILTGEPRAVSRAIPLDTLVEVEEPKEYYELYVERRDSTSGATESMTIQFIVRASERDNTEWGIPPWTPYPPVPSATTEFVGSTLALVVPQAYPQGLEIPVIALVRDGSGRRVGVNGRIQASGLPDHSIRIFRGVGSGSIPPVTSPGNLTYDARIATVHARRDITIEATTTWTSASGTIPSSATWGGDSRIHVTGDLTVAAGATLTIQAGSVIRIAPSTDIEVSGHLLVEGTPEDPVIFTAEERSRPWGGFLLREGTSRATVTGAVFTRSGADPAWFDNVSGSGYSHRREQALFYASNGARVTLTDSFLVDGAGQAGHGEDADFTLTRCLVQKFTTAGQFNGGTLTFTDSAFVEFPSFDAPYVDADNDAMYLSRGPRTLTGCLVGWTTDDGIDGGGEADGLMQMRDCWFESTYHEGFALTDDGDRVFRDCVAINCGQGFESGYGTSAGDVEGCLLTANLVGLRFGDNYDWTYDNSLSTTNSLLLFNVKDVWSRAWDDWTRHLSQTEIVGNYLTLADPVYPDNLVWDPAADASRLVPFLPTPAATVGVGIAMSDPEPELSRFGEGIPVRLSTFTTVPVSVGYSVTTDLGAVEQGRLEFVPGESLKILHPEVADPQGHPWIRVTLTDPVQSEITELPEVLFVHIPTETLVARGSTWKYGDGGVDLGSAWRAPQYDDSAWPAGPAELGDGDGDEATEIDIGPSDDRFPTLYFRRSFELADPGWVTELHLSLKRDDGAVVYLNGGEALRDNMPAGTIGYGTWAASVVAGSAEDGFHFAELDPAGLVAGTNVVAVEVHQADAGSSDISFDLELVARGSASPGPFFVRGDANHDGELDISDAVRALLVLFGGETTSCRDALDSNDDGIADITDAIYLLDYLFRGGAVIPPPFPRRGEDPTTDGLSCGW